VSSSQSLEVSVYRGVKVSECAVRILACSLVRQTLLLDFGTLKTKRSTVYTLVFVAKRVARNAEEVTLYNK
jgi:hypothetical protein